MLSIPSAARCGCARGRGGAAGQRHPPDEDAGSRSAARRLLELAPGYACRTAAPAQPAARRSRSTPARSAGTRRRSSWPRRRRRLVRVVDRPVGEHGDLGPRVAPGLLGAAVDVLERELDAVRVQARQQDDAVGDPPGQLQRLRPGGRDPDRDVGLHGREPVVRVIEREPAGRHRDVRPGPQVAHAESTPPGRRAGRGLVPHRSSGRSPAPMPSVNRPPEISAMVAAAAAVTPGCRVTGLVTAVPRCRRDVARAASVRYDQQLRVCSDESVSHRVSYPSRSISVTLASKAPGLSTPCRQIAVRTQFSLADAKGATRSAASSVQRPLAPRGEVQDPFVVSPRADDLQADRHAVRREAARDADGRLPGDVERVGVGRPGDPRQLALLPRRRAAPRRRGERGQRHRRHHQQVHVVEQREHGAYERPPRVHRRVVIGERVLLGQPEQPHQAGVHDRRRGRGSGRRTPGRGR